MLSYTYDAWGNHTTAWYSATGIDYYASYNPFRYRGYYYDTETSLYYLQSRYYNPQWGRFLNVDAYLSTGTGLIGYNMYAYCDNNPVIKVDPTGYFGISTSCDLEGRYDILRDESEIGAGSAYHTYVVRNATAARDANLYGYYYEGMASVPSNIYYYYVPGAVTVTDDMATNSASGTVKKIHGNSKQSTNEQHGYIIYDRELGGAAKVGISGQPLNKNGTSPRANRQVNQWNKAVGYERYCAIVIERNMPNRQEALNWEKRTAKELRDVGHPMHKHMRP